MRDAESQGEVGEKEAEDVDPRGLRGNLSPLPSKWRGREVPPHLGEGMENWRETCPQAG